VYKCVVTNKCGSVECTARLNVISKKEAEEEFPANQSTMCMVHMEKAMKKYTTEMVMTEDDVFDAERNQPPRFMSQMRSNTHVAEMSRRCEATLTSPRWRPPSLSASLRLWAIPA